MIEINDLINALKPFVDIKDFLVSKDDINYSNYKKIILRDCEYFLYVSKDANYKTIYSLKYILELFLRTNIKYLEKDAYMEYLSSMVKEVLDSSTAYAKDNYSDAKGFEFLSKNFNYVLLQNDIVTINTGIDKYTLETSLLKLDNMDEFSMYVKNGEVYACKTKYYKVIVYCNTLIDDVIKTAIKVRLIFTNKLYENENYSQRLEIINSELEETVKLRTLEIMKKNELLEKEKIKLNKANIRLKNLNKQLDELSRIDPLTKLSNRRDLQEKFEYESERSQRKNTSLSLIIGDIDFFKSVNDTYGHECGDQVLIKVANIFRKNLCRENIVARYGGEEFVILLVNIDNKSSLAVVEKLRTIIEKETFIYMNSDFHITISFGLYNFQGKVNFTESIEKADEALYEAKNTGRNKTMAYTV